MPLAQATQPPVPKRKTEALEVFKSRLGQEEQQKEELSRKLEKIDKDVEKTREKLVGIAGAIQDNERALRELQTRINRLEEKKKEGERELQKDRASIARLIVALERIRRMPPEAILARPETPYKNAQSAMLMRSIIPVINRHAEKLRVNLETLENVTTELEGERNTFLEISENLKTRQDKLSDLLDRRKILYRKTNKDYKAQEAQIQQISLQAKNLEDLVKKLEEEDVIEQAPRRPVAAPKIPVIPESKVETVVTLEKPQYRQTALRQRPLFQRSGKQAQLPISGIIRTQYQQKDALGASSNGLTIEGRPGALVVAPMGGKIQFAGPFKRYGNLIIIEHTNGYHSLIAGLEVINTVVGQTVVAGEPLGAMPNSALAVRPKLYYELRLKGQPVNPALKFSDLG